MTNLREVGAAGAGAGRARTALRRIMRWPTLLVLALVPAFLSLGQWQWAKAERKAQAQALAEARRADAAVSLPGAALPAGSPAAQALHGRPLALAGRFLPAYQFLLDNQVHRERAGVHVLTPFRPEGADAVILVDRGWIPAPAERATPPQIETPGGPVAISGIAVVPPDRQFVLAATGATPDWRAAPLPYWQRLDLEAFARQSALPTHGVVLRLDPGAPAGFVRAWPRPDERIERHYSYALQWAGFALATVGIWLWWLLRKESR